MPFIGTSPEALLSRNDSKNPATTCKGITANGRPCRRALASSAGNSPSPSPRRESGASSRNGRGVLAVLSVDDLDGNRAAAFYCWQHKDQAEQLTTGKKNKKTEVFPLTKRSSIETLVDRLGILDLDEENPNQTKKKKKRAGAAGHHPTRRDTLPQAWHDVSGPLMTVPEAAFEQSALPSQRPSRPSARPQQAQKLPPKKASLLCCVIAVEDDYHPPPRQSRPNGTQVNSQARPRPQQNSRPEMILLQRESANGGRKPVPSNLARPRPSQGPLQNQLAPHSNSSDTRTLLSLIPSSLSPQTTSVLLTELARPISTADEEGYIYMFWLTPSSFANGPDDEVASTLLAPPSTSRDRRGSDALRTFATSRTVSSGSVSKSKASRTVLLKIGRAANVHRRMNQWSRQCDYNVTLIRYYPYDSSAQPSQQQMATLGRKVPHVHRVERLIHLELADKRVKDMGACQACGKEHREWFEIQADRDGVKQVDEVIRRWVSWAERQNNA